MSEAVKRKSRKKPSSKGKREREKLRKIDPVNDKDADAKIENIFKDKFPTEIMCTSSEEEDDEEELLKDIPKESKDHPKRDEQKIKLTQITDKLDRTLFIGNLPMTVKKTDIRRIIRSHMEAKKTEVKIESIRFRGGVSKSASTSKGARKRATILRDMKGKENYSLIAYVVFEKKEHVKDFIELNGVIFEFKVGDIMEKRHLRFDVVTKKPEIKGKRNCVVAGNLPLDASEEKVHELFQEYGTVVNVRLIRDAATGAVKGLGFIEFSDVESRNKCLKAPEIKYGSRPLRLKKYMPKENKLTKTGKSAPVKRSKLVNKKDSQTPATKKSDKKKNKKRPIPTNISRAQLLSKKIKSRPDRKEGKKKKQDKKKDASKENK